jgi:hypothetical protein
MANTQNPPSGKEPDTRDKPTIVPGDLNTSVALVMGQLFYRDAKGTPKHCVFQFNPTEIERSRTISFTRSPTGNTLEEPRPGDRNQAKRKQTRKVQPWEMSVTLRFDAAYGMVAGNTQSPLPKIAESPKGPRLSDEFTSATPSFNSATATFRNELQRIDETIKFFEALAEPGPFVTETDKIANADETAPPPYVILAFGERAWHCAVKSVRIKEEDYTPYLLPRRFEATLSLEIIESTRQNLQGKGPLL